MKTHFRRYLVGGLWVAMMMASGGCKPQATPPAGVQLEPRMADLVQEYQTATDDGLRQQVLRELGMVESRGAVDALMVLLRDETNATRQVTIVDQIGERKGDRIVEALVEAIGKRYPAGVRLAAIDALIFLDDPRAIPPLEKLAGDSNSEIREAAAEAIDWLKTPRLSAETLKQSKPSGGP